MLRAAISVAAILFVVFSLMLSVLSLAAWPTLAVSLAIALGCLFERRYRAATAPPPPESGLRPTGERFVDPATGHLVSVWADATGGRRQYVEDDMPPDTAG